MMLILLRIKKTLHDSTAQSVEIENDIWPPKVKQYIYGLFEDGVYPGEVKSVDKEYVICRNKHFGSCYHSKYEIKWKS